METPNENQQFKTTPGDYRNWLKPPFIITAFEKATTSMTWAQVEEAIARAGVNSEWWEQVLPVPDIDSSELEFDPQWRANFRNLKRRDGQHESIESLTEERKRIWEKMIMKWLSISQSIIRKQEKQLYRVCQMVINEWDSEGRTTSLTVDELVKRWSRQHGDKPISWLKNQVITLSAIGPFVGEIIKQRKAISGLEGSSLPEFLPSQQQTPPLGVGKKTRGPYKNPQRDYAISYYKSGVRDAIVNAVRTGKKLDKAKIEKPIMDLLLKNKNYNDRTLRQHLSAKIRDQLFGEIYRQVLDYNPNITR